MKKECHQRERRRGWSCMTDLEWIKQYGKTAQGKTEYLEYLGSGKKLSPARAIKATCYQCMNSYVDGKNDCGIPDCPLYPFMPYRRDKVSVKRERSEKQLEHDRKLAILGSGAHKTMNGSKS